MCPQKVTRPELGKWLDCFTLSMCISLKTIARILLNGNCQQPPLFVYFSKLHLDSTVPAPIPRLPLTFIIIVSERLGAKFFCCCVRYVLRMMALLYYPGCRKWLCLARLDYPHASPIVTSFCVRPLPYCVSRPEKMCYCPSVATISNCALGELRFWSDNNAKLLFCDITMTATSDEIETLDFSLTISPRSYLTIIVIVGRRLYRPV